MAAPKEKEQRFDQAKLQGMHEPLTVRVEKIRGNVRQPIELPPKGSENTGFHPPGTNWTRDEVLGLENFILTKWSGGGYYEFTVTDAKGDRMTWQGVWDPRIYAEKIPPNTAEAAMVSPQPIGVPTGGPQMVPTMSQPLGMQMQSGWPPSSNALGYNNPPHTGPVMPPVTPLPTATAQPNPGPASSQAPPMWAPQGQPFYGQGPYGMPPGYPPYGMPQGPFGYQNWQGYPPPPYAPPQPRARFTDDEARERRARWDREDEETKELKARLQQAELNHKEAEYKAALERIQQQSNQQIQQMQQQHAAQMQAVQDEIRRMGETRNKGEDDEVRRMREEQQRLREAAAAERAALERQLFEQRLQQERDQANAQMQMLRDQLARMSEQPRGESDEVRRIREEQDRLRQESERQRQEHERRMEMERAERERERERFEQQRRDEILQREMRETREANERRFEQMQMAAHQNQTNPMVEAMKESARMQAEAQREIARMQADASNRMAQFMVSPTQLAGLMKDHGSGADSMIRNIIGSVGEIGALYKNAAESIMNMSGGGGDPPAARLIQEGIGRASEVAERFLAVKRDQVISEGKVKQAEALRDQTRIQAEASLRSQAMNAQAQQRAGWSPPPPVAQAGAPVNGNGSVQHAQAQAQAQPGAGLSGAPRAQTVPPPQRKPNGSNGQPKKPTGPIDLPPEVTQEAQGPVQKSTGPIDHPSQVVVAAKPTTGPSDEEFFGMAVESVYRLRRGIASGQLDPSKTIDAILQGVATVVQRQLVIPAFVLFQQERWADFIDAMIPDAPEPFRIECVRILAEEVEKAPADAQDGA